MLLYHYCSTETFHSIVKYGSIRLSSLSQANDTMEGRWVRGIFDQLCDEHNLGSYTKERLLEHLQMLRNFADGLAFCLSGKPDILSQWRGYANDGRGFSVGFSSEYLVALRDKRKERDEASFGTVKVEYELEEQKKVVLPIFLEMKEIIARGALRMPRSILGSAGKTAEELAKEDDEAKKASNDFSLSLLGLLNHLYRIKNPAFAEEDEWRLLSYLIGDDDECEFRTAADRIIPYREFHLEELDTPPIEEVYLGPRNISQMDDVGRFLKRHGLKDCGVKRSSATYR